MPPDDPLAADVARLRKRLLAAHKAKRAALAEAERLRADLAARPPAEDDPYAGLTPERRREEIRELHEEFKRSRCQTCGGLHARACPRVRRVKYMTQGDRVLIESVDYWPDGKWSEEGIVFENDLPPLEEP